MEIFGLSAGILEKVTHANAGSHSPAKILVIEDNPGDLVLLRYGLDYHKKEYALAILMDGEEAIRFVDSQRLDTSPVPCVIVLDLHLPKHNGPTVLKEIRRLPALAHVHVVVWTTQGSPAEVREVHQLGVQLYRTKPAELAGWVALGGEILELCHQRSHVVTVGK
jgi:two-component system response regulator